MQVTLPAEIEQLVQAKVSSGQYESTDEFVLACIRLRLERDLLFEKDKERLRVLIEEGILQADAGRLIDGEEFLRSLG